jgi:hypothetical protein
MDFKILWPEDWHMPTQHINHSNIIIVDREMFETLKDMKGEGEE